MNPGKVVRPNPILSDLRLGHRLRPAADATLLRYPRGRRLVRPRRVPLRGGRQVPRATTGGSMCPSYMVTREEQHSTRGRARLLFEMLNGRELEGGWRNDEVEEALDLCLACKGCKGDCPVNVDMATYKAEFRAHY